MILNHRFNLRCLLIIQGLNPGEYIFNIIIGNDSFTFISIFRGFSMFYKCFILKIIHDLQFPGIGFIR
jgi:hypothetical protein